MLDKAELEAWLANLPDAVPIWIDDGGLTLVSGTGAYLEVGGSEEP